MKEIFPDINEKRKIKESPPKDCTFVFIVGGIEKKYRFEGETPSGRYSLYNVETDFMTDMTPSFFRFWIDRKLKSIIVDDKAPEQKPVEPIKVIDESPTDKEVDEYYAGMIKGLRSAKSPDLVKEIIGKDPSELADEIEAASNETPFDSGKYGRLMNEYLKVKNILTA